ncbi:hypothetical protein G9C85_16565 [Halorubellus sp. JP-L1]|uniref:HalOD1 output domain-containing protein n=1 Tax=Halorubellus sp. JP-L1 TaxID=2715753 RepID=UPI0014081181|nr:hypothetical protein [Halorubellus sp. JP-L1]
MTPRSPDTSTTEWRNSRTDDDVEHDPETGAYRVRCEDTARRSPVEAVVELVATVVGRDELDVGPLYDVVDVDALEQLVGWEDSRPAVASGDSRPGVRSVSFGFEGCDVTIDGGWVIVAPNASSDR